MAQNDEQLQQLLGYSFKNHSLLDRALTHSSAVPELRAAQQGQKLASSQEPRSNEQLEFLGDAVLDMLASEYLLRTFPDWSEGQLSKSRAWIVNANALEIAARRLELGNHLRLGRGEEKTGGREKPALLADAYEAVIAAVYMDGGIEAAREVLERTLLKAAMEERGAAMAESDRKSALQEFLQARGMASAEYRLVAEIGPDHQKVFYMEVWMGGKRLATGEGTTKKEAEQRAAQSALRGLQESAKETT